MLGLWKDDRVAMNSTLIQLAKSSDLEFHTVFKLWRKMTLYSARSLSLACGLSASYVSKIESGALIPPLNTFMKLVTELQLTPAEISFLLGLAHD